jgi:hypothetical protein
MISLKNYAGTPDGRFMASARSSDSSNSSNSSKRGGKAALWFESSAQRFEEQESKLYLEPEPPSERPRKDLDGAADEAVEKLSK